MPFKVVMFLHDTWTGNGSPLTATEIRESLMAGDFDSILDVEVEVLSIEEVSADEVKREMKK